MGCVQLGSSLNKRITELSVNARSSLFHVPIPFLSEMQKFESVSLGSGLDPKHMLQLQRGRRLFQH